MAQFSAIARHQDNVAVEVNAPVVDFLHYHPPCNMTLLITGRPGTCMLNLTLIIVGITKKTGGMA